MMLDNLHSLTENEFAELKDAFALVTVLIAGADGTINDEEISWADKVTDIRSYNLTGDLKEFYDDLHHGFVERVNHFILISPKDTNERTQFISSKLEGINPILAKVDPEIGSKLYKGLLSFAEHVAKASGGILGFFSINKEEAKLMHLSMITPILFEKTEEDQEEDADQ